MENGINGKYYKRTFLLFTAALFFAFLWATVIRDDSDFYHILTSGRDIWETGRIPVWNTHFAYDGLQIVIQQWLYAFIVYGIYHVFGWAGMQVFLWIEFAILFLLLYKIGTQRGLSHLHIVVCFIPVVFLCSVFLTPRPYLVTVILLLWQFYVQEAAFVYKREKVAWFLPVIFLLAINLHGALWPYHAGMLVLFLLPLAAKHIRFFSKRFVLDVHIRWWQVCLIPVCFGTLFLNPYGIDLVLYVFRAMRAGVGSSMISISETGAPSLLDRNINFALWFLFYILYQRFVRKTKLSFIDTSLYLTGFILTAHVLRHIPILVIGEIMLLYSPLFAGIFEVPFWHRMFSYCMVTEKNRRQFAGLCCMIVLVSCFMQPHLVSERSAFLDMQQIADYLQEKNYEGVVYTFFEPGCYMEYFGYIVASDGRPELLSESINKKEDLIDIFKDPLLCHEFIDRSGAEYGIAKDSYTKLYFNGNLSWEDITDQFSFSEKGLKVYHRIDRSELWNE